MRIEKWYADCITPDGAVFIGYAARLQLGVLPLPLQSVMVGARGEPLSQEWTVSARGRAPLPDGALRWRWPRLKLDAAWTPLAQGVARVLLAAPELKLTWRCHMPRAEARVRVGHRVLSGLGYLEELVVEGDPRKVPIQELRWGRFLGEASSVVWIDWKGPHPLTHVFRNGVEMAGSAVDDARVHFAGHRLELGGEGSWVLRDDLVEESIFPSVPLLRKALPTVLARLHETKWAGPGVLKHPEGGHERGWLLHERVVWP